MKTQEEQTAHVLIPRDALALAIPGLIVSAQIVRNQARALNETVLPDIPDADADAEDHVKWWVTATRMLAT